MKRVAKIYQWVKETPSAKAYTKEDRCFGTVHGFTVESEEGNLGPIIYPVAIVEMADGMLETDPIALIQLLAEDPA